MSIPKISSYRGYMNKKGFSLTEILVALGLMGILGSIAVVSYNGFMLSTTKRTLNDSARLFVSAVDLCVKASGGWEVKRYSKTVRGGIVRVCWAWKCDLQKQLWWGNNR